MFVEKGRTIKGTVIGAAAGDDLVIDVIEDKIHTVFLIKNKHGRSEVFPQSYSIS